MAADRLALDTSAAVPFLLRSHGAHLAVRAALSGVIPLLVGHAVIETYSVLTRLPGDARLLPVDAAALIRNAFAATKAVEVPPLGLVTRIAGLGIGGGAVYDAYVAAAATAHRARLATRDARALATYALMGAEVLVVG